MTLFYRGPTARVTNEVLEVCSPTYQSFAISELQSVHVVRQRLARESARRLRVLAVTLPGVIVALAAFGWPVLGLLLTSLAALAVLVVSAMVAIVIWKVHRTSLELWATYRGEPTRLFQTTDSLTFGQVSRALRRVFELIDDRQ
jgi:fatty acid desaturase